MLSRLDMLNTLLNLASALLVFWASLNSALFKKIKIYSNRLLA